MVAAPEEADDDDEGENEARCSPVEAMRGSMRRVVALLKLSGVNCFAVDTRELKHRGTSPFTGVGVVNLL